jgi:hypothetical protein
VTPRPGPFRSGAAVVALAFMVLTPLAACTSSGGSTKAFCAALQAGPDPVDLFAAYDPVSGTTAQLETGIQRLRDLADVAPTEAKAALEDLIAVATDLSGTIDARSSATPADPPPTMPARDIDRATNASATVVRIAAEKCGITPGAPTTATPTTAGPTSTN